MNDFNAEITAARRTCPSLSDAQWAEWHAQMAANGGSLVLPFDGSACFAIYTYPVRTRPCPCQCAAIDKDQ